MSIINFQHSEPIQLGNDYATQQKQPKKAKNLHHEHSNKIINKHQLQLNENRNVKSKLSKMLMPSKMKVGNFDFGKMKRKEMNRDLGDESSRNNFASSSRSNSQLPRLNLSTERQNPKQHTLGKATFIEIQNKQQNSQ